MIVHISQPIVVSEVVQIHTKPSDTQQSPPIAPVDPLHSKKAVDKVGDFRFHSTWPVTVITTALRNKLTETVPTYLTIRNRFL